jgi:hypothetical protein
MPERFRVTYATLSADNEDLHAAYDEGLRVARSWFGETVPACVSGKPRTSGGTFDVVSPADQAVLCRVHEATPADLDDAVAAASVAAPGWAARSWQERIVLLRAAADLISDRSNELAALMSMEVGKNRLEALGDVEETADLIRYYCTQVEDNDGFSRMMDRLSAGESTMSVLRPYGVWGVISPFNFPMALAGGPAGGALAVGNTVLLKPSMQGSFSAVKLFECLRDAGVPADVVHLLPGGDEVGKALVAHPGIAGLTFTGSYDAGMSIYRSFASAYPKPVICEMGGKNPVIVSAKADLGKAATGVARSQASADLAGAAWLDATRPVPDIRTPLPGPRGSAIYHRDQRVTSPSLTRAYPLMPQRGSGAVIEDVDGNLFLDFNAGIAVNSTGHCHPRVVAAVQKQAADLLHYSASDFYLPVYSQMCQALAATAPMPGPVRVFLTNSGAEAVEGALKLVRYATGRPNVIGFFGAFHGRTCGAVTLTASRAKYHKGFGPLLPGVFHAP